MEFKVCFFIRYSFYKKIMALFTGLNIRSHHRLQGGDLQT